MFGTQVVFDHWLNRYRYYAQGFGKGFTRKLQYSVNHINALHYLLSLAHTQTLNKTLHLTGTSIELKRKIIKMFWGIVFFKPFEISLLSGDGVCAFKVNFFNCTGQVICYKCIHFDIEKDKYLIFIAINTNIFNNGKNNFLNKVNRSG